MNGNSAPSRLVPRPNWAITLQTVLLLSLLGLDPTETVRVVLALGVVVLFGNLIVERLGFFEAVPAVGWFVGLSMLVLSSQVLVIIGMRAELAQSLVVMAFGCALAGAKILKRGRREVLAHAGALRFAFVVTLLSATLVLPWMLPFAGCCLIGLKGSRTFDTRAVSRPVFLRGVVPAFGATVTFMIRPENWFLQNSNDLPFFEALSWSVTRYGVFEHPGYVGGSIADYHWFAYGLMGSVSLLGGLEPWEAMLKLLPVAMLAATASTVWSLFRQYTEAGEMARVPNLGFSLAAVTLFVSRTPHSYQISLIFALVFILIAKEISIRQISRRNSILICLIASLTLVTSKVSTALVVAGLLVAVVLVASPTHSTHGWSTALAVLVMTFAGFSTAVFASGAGSGVVSYVASSSPNMNYVLEVVRYLIGDPKPFLSMFLIVAATVTTRTRMNGRAERDVLYLAGIATTFIGIALFLALNTTTSGYFGLPALQILGLVSITRLDFVFRTRHQDCIARHRTVWLVIVAGVTVMTLAYRQIIWWINGEVIDLMSVLPRTLVSILATPAPFVILTISVLLVLRTRASGTRDRSRLLVAAVLTCGGFLMGHTLYEYVERSRLDATFYQNSGGNEAAYPSEDLTAVGEFVRKNTPPDIVLASNNFCCSGTDWWNEGDPQHPWGGANYLLPAETRRRFLLQGPRFLGSMRRDFPSSDIRERMALSLKFANDPSYETTEALRVRGVGGFIVNLSLTEHRDWGLYATERHRAGVFVYLSLK